MIRGYDAWRGYYCSFHFLPVSIGDGNTARCTALRYGALSYYTVRRPLTQPFAVYRVFFARQVCQNRLLLPSEHRLAQ